MKNTNRPFWQALLIQVLGTALGVLLTLGTGQLIAEVDRRGRYYVVFCNGHNVGQRSNKDAAIGYAQRCVKDCVPNPVEFKGNVMSYRQK